MKSDRQKNLQKGLFLPFCETESVWVDNLKRQPPFFDRKGDALQHAIFVFREPVFPLSITMIEKT